MKMGGKLSNRANGIEGIFRQLPIRKWRCFLSWHTNKPFVPFNIQLCMLLLRVWVHQELCVQSAHGIIILVLVPAGRLPYSTIAACSGFLVSIQFARLYLGLRIPIDVKPTVQQVRWQHGIATAILSALEKAIAFAGAVWCTIHTTILLFPVKGWKLSTEIIL